MGGEEKNHVPLPLVVVKCVRGEGLFMVPSQRRKQIYCQFIVSVELKPKCWQWSCVPGIGMALGMQNWNLSYLGGSEQEMLIIRIRRSRKSI